MEWTKVHDLILAKEVGTSEPWIFKPRTVNRSMECYKPLSSFSLRKESQDFSASLNPTTLEIHPGL